MVSEVRRQAEVEKEIAITETKKKKWVSCITTSIITPNPLSLSLII